MRNEPATADTTLKKTDEIELSPGALLQESGSPAPVQRPVRYATDEEARLASEKVFRLHSKLLSELAK